MQFRLRHNYLINYCRLHKYIFESKVLNNQSKLIKIKWRVERKIHQIFNKRLDFIGVIQIIRI